MFNTTTVDEAAEYLMDQFEEEINESYENRLGFRTDSFTSSKAVTREELFKLLKLISITPKDYLKCKIDSYTANRKTKKQDAEPEFRSAGGTA